MIETFWVQIHAKNVPDDKSKLLDSSKKIVISSLAQRWFKHDSFLIDMNTLGMVRIRVAYNMPTKIYFHERFC